MKPPTYHEESKHETCILFESHLKPPRKEFHYLLNLHGQWNCPSTAFAIHDFRIVANRWWCKQLLQYIKVAMWYSDYFPIQEHGKGKELNREIQFIWSKDCWFDINLNWYKNCLSDQNMHVFQPRDKISEYRNKVKFWWEMRELLIPIALILDYKWTKRFYQQQVYILRHSSMAKRIIILVRLTFDNYKIKR